MRYPKKFKKAFTLIELLVVISIIAILATLLIANYNAARGRARDAQRKSDLRNIQTALRLYYNDYASYPVSTSTKKIKGCVNGTTTCTWGQAFSVTATNPDQIYMNILPADPQSDRTYVYDQTGPDAYTLSACLENVSDDKCGNPCTSAYGVGTPTGCIYTVQP